MKKKPTPKCAKLYLQGLNAYQTAKTAKTEAKDALIDHMAKNFIPEIVVGDRLITLDTVHKLRVTTIAG